MTWALAVAAAGLALGGESGAVTNRDGRGPFTVPVYDRADPNRVTALLSGVIARFQLSQQQPLETVRVEYYDVKGQTNLIIEGTNCVYDARMRAAFSPDYLRVRSGDGRLDLQGQGFSWSQTNNDLVISNRVETRVQRGEDAATALHVKADQFQFSYQSNSIYYTGQVQVEDPQFHLNCERLRIQRSASGGFEAVEAFGKVSVVDRLNQGRATGDRAIYLARPGGDWVELSGNPEWHDGRREGTADRFVLDRMQHTLQAIGQAQFRVPIDAAGTPTLLSLEPAARADTPDPGNRLLEIAADVITLHLPETNGPVRRIVADTNVVLVDHAQASMATAARATFDHQGVLELTGDPLWSAGDRTVRGGVMRYETTNRVFTIHSNVSVSLPAASLSRPLAALAAGAQAKLPATSSNQVVEIRSPELAHHEPWLRFTGGVEGEVLEAERQLGTLRCQALEIRYRTQVEAVRAVGGVRLAQLPVTRADGHQVAKGLECQTLAVDFDAAGRVSQIRAEGDVTAHQSSQPPGAAAVAPRKELWCDTFTARFTGTTNRLETMTAEGSVRVQQGDRSATAEQAMYDAAADVLTLSGHPLVELPQGSIRDADRLVWERKTGKYRAVGPFKSRWKNLPVSTNRFTLPSNPPGKAR